MSFAAVLMMHGMGSLRCRIQVPMARRCGLHTHPAGLMRTCNTEFDAVEQGTRFGTYRGCLLTLCPWEVYHLLKMCGDRPRKRREEGKDEERR